MFRIGQEEIDAVTRVIQSGNLFKINDGAREVMHFEEEFCEKMGTAHTTLMTSGQGALVSALIGMGIGPGDEVIVPAYTYIATAIAVTSVGAIPVIADADATLTLDPDAFASKISAHTKAVIPVHIQGFPCNMKRIMEIAKEHGIYVLEDACQADGGSFEGKRLGTIGDAGAYSFNYFKVITAGEGGALVTNDRTIYERALIYHDSSAIAYFGNQLDEVNATQFCGTEFRTSEITGAIMREQLKRMDGILTDLRARKAYLMEKLSGKYRFIPSNDLAGDCATTLPFLFDSAEEAIAFKTSFGGTRPIDTGKHVYTNWTPIMNHTGAVHPAMDPFKMAVNQGLNMEYTMDMCETTLRYLERVVYHSLHPDTPFEQLDKYAWNLLA